MKNIDNRELINIMCIPYKYIFLTFIIGVGFTFKVASQDDDKKTTRLRADYFKESDGSEKLVAKLIIREERYLPYAGAEVNFYSVHDTTVVLLGKTKTDSEGEATYVFVDNAEIFIDSTGLMTFELDYEGTDTSKEATADIAVRRSDLRVSFLQEDTIKYIEVFAEAIDPKDASTSIEGIDLSIYVKGMFSLYTIGEQETNEKGRAMIEFPVDMPGDTAGVLTIVARIVDDDTYGNVEAAGKINWGVVVPLPEEPHRGLGDTDAPLWMVYTLIFLLSVVWFHYLYVIYTIFKIKVLRNAIRLD